VVYWPNVVVGMRSGVWRRWQSVRCEGCCSHRSYSLRRHTPDLQPTTTLGQYSITTLL